MEETNRKTRILDIARFLRIKKAQPVKEGLSTIQTNENKCYSTAFSLISLMIKAASVSPLTVKYTYITIADTVIAAEK